MKKIVRKLLQGCSLTAAMFVFQACYGTGEYEWGNSIQYNFRIVDENNNTIDGIALQTRWENRDDQGNLTACGRWEPQGISGTDGVVSAYVYDREFPSTIFQFSDGQSRFEMLDTTFASLSGMDTVEIKLQRIADE